jgi:hypothetical protein
MRMIWVVAFLFVTVLFCAAAYRQEKEDRNQKAAAKNATDEQGREIRKLTSLLSESKSVEANLRLSLLDIQEQAISAERKSLQMLRELPTSSVTSLETLDRIRDAQLADAALASKQAAIQAEKEKISRETRLKEAEQERRKQEAQSADRWLPLFEYVVRTLHRKLEDLSRETGASLTSDFASSLPSMHGSRMVKDGVLVKGENMMQLGTSSAWLFRISLEPQAIRSQPALIISVKEGAEIRSRLMIRHAGHVVAEGNTAPKTVAFNLTGKATFNSAASLSDYASAVDNSLTALIANQHMEEPLRKQ